MAGFGLEPGLGVRAVPRVLWWAGARLPHCRCCQALPAADAARRGRRASRTISECLSETQN